MGLKAKGLYQAELITTEQLGPEIYRTVWHCPEIAQAIEPGQFMNIFVPGNPAEVCRLPFGCSQAKPEEGSIEILYQVVGSGTTRLKALPQHTVTDIIGPAGRGWNCELEAGSSALVVAGGLGLAPLMELVRTLAQQGVAVDVVIGVPSHDRLVFTERLLEYGARHIYVSTDDGSCGYHGFCTDITAVLLMDAEDSFEADERQKILMQAALKGEKGADAANEVSGAPRYAQVYTCGPEIMQHKVKDQALLAGIPCQVSLERGMICGFGACLTCVVKKEDGERVPVCLDGPVFDAEEIDWNAK